MIAISLTQYLLDVQPGLYNVLASTTGPDTTRFVKHGNRILRQEVDGQWRHLLADGLGSVRSVLDANLLPLETIHYSPYGAGSPAESLHGFTGEPTDANGLVHLRARYYDPALGVFPSLDPVEGNPSQPLSLARYAYVQGNPVNAVDPSGMFGETPGGFDSCFNFPIDPGESCNQCPEGWEVITSTRCLSRSDCAEALNSATRNRNLRQRPIVMCSRLGSVGFAAREELFNRADMPDPCSDRYPESESLFGPLLDVLGLRYVSRI